MIKKLLERVYNLLDQTLYSATREDLEARIVDLKSEQDLLIDMTEKLELDKDRLIDANDELMITIENYQDEISNLTLRRWA